MSKNPEPNLHAVRQWLQEGSETIPSSIGSPKSSMGLGSRIPGRTSTNNLDIPPHKDAAMPEPVSPAPSLRDEMKGLLQQLMDRYGYATPSQQPHDDGTPGYTITVRHSSKPTIMVDLDADRHPSDGELAKLRKEINNLNTSPDEVVATTNVVVATPTAVPEPIAPATVVNAPAGVKSPAYDEMLRLFAELRNKHGYSAATPTANTHNGRTVTLTYTARHPDKKSISILTAPTGIPSSEKLAELREKVEKLGREKELAATPTITPSVPAKTKASGGWSEIEQLQRFRRQLETLESEKFGATITVEDGKLHITHKRAGIDERIALNDETGLFAKILGIVSAIGKHKADISASATQLAEPNVIVHQSTEPAPSATTLVPPSRNGDDHAENEPQRAEPTEGKRRGRPFMPGAQIFGAPGVADLLRQLREIKDVTVTMDDQERVLHISHSPSGIHKDILYSEPRQNREKQLRTVFTRIRTASKTAEPKDAVPTANTPVISTVLPALAAAHIAPTREGEPLPPHTPSVSGIHNGEEASTATARPATDGTPALLPDTQSVPVTTNGAIATLLTEKVPTPTAPSYESLNKKIAEYEASFGSQIKTRRESTLVEGKPMTREQLAEAVFAQLSVGDEPIDPKIVRAWESGAKIPERRAERDEYEALAKVLIDKQADDTGRVRNIDGEMISVKDARDEFDAAYQASKAAYDRGERPDGSFQDEVSALGNLIAHYRENLKQQEHRNYKKLGELVGQSIETPLPEHEARLLRENPEGFFRAIEAGRIDASELSSQLKAALESVFEKTAAQAVAPASSARTADAASEMAETAAAVLTGVNGGEPVQVAASPVGSAERNVAQPKADTMHEEKIIPAAGIPTGRRTVSPRPSSHAAATQSPAEPSEAEGISYRDAQAQVNTYFEGLTKTDVAKRAGLPAQSGYVSQMLKESDHPLVNIKFMEENKAKFMALVEELHGQDAADRFSSDYDAFVAATRRAKQTKVAAVG